MLLAVPVAPKLNVHRQREEVERPREVEQEGDGGAVAWSDVEPEGRGGPFVKVQAGVGGAAAAVEGVEDGEAPWYREEVDVPGLGLGLGLGFVVMGVPMMVS